MNGMKKKKARWRKGQVGRGATKNFVGVPYNTQKIHRETPFSMTYGAKAVIPTEVSLCSARVEEFTPTQNDELMTESLNLLEEHREAATIRLAEYQ